MGLAGPRKNTKIGNDPNNTNWTRSTSGFGHRIMSSQGWTPGSLLGAKNAAHGNMLTAASASHIKVTIKDDTLGLGARIGRETEQTGLDAFKGLLGRLNGKSDVELKKDERKRDDIRLARYAALKFPEVRFVSGGLLAQEKTEIPSPIPEDADNQRSQETKRARTTDDDETSSSESDAPTRKSRSKKTKSKSKSKSKKKEMDDSEKKKSKKRKVDYPDSPSDKASESQIKTSISKERRPMGRNVTRSRYIAQKKRAIMDDKSLNEIFMVKA